MADILIRGMEMPNNVFDCPLNSFGICNLAQDETHCDCIGDSRPEWCPLVPLPEGHGRLGDLDALLEQIRDGFEKAEKWRDAVENDPEIRPRAEATVVAFWECGVKVKKAPTIVPAEGGSE